MSTNTASMLGPLGAFVSVATIERADDPRALAVSSEHFGTMPARLAVVGDYVPRAGDSVLVLSDPQGERYVVGVLRALREAAPKTEPLLRRAEDGSTVITVAEGDLRLEASAGRIELNAARGVVVTSELDLTLHAKGRVDIASQDDDGRARSALHLAGDAAELKAGLLTAKAAHLHVVAEQATVLARHVDTHLERLRQRAERIETEADQIVEKAKDSYRRVEGLAQTHAGRLKLVAETTLHALADRVKMRANRAFSVDGEKIYLG